MAVLVNLCFCPWKYYTNKYTIKNSKIYQEENRILLKKKIEKKNNESSTTGLGVRVLKKCDPFNALLNSCIKLFIANLIVINMLDE